MTGTKIKICGLTRMRDIEFVNALRPDFAGFVFAGKSRRYISPGTAAALREQLDPGIIPVGVFADAPLETVAELMRGGVVSVAQLHGRESGEYVAALRRLAVGPVIQAFRIESAADVERAVRSSAEFLLLDHGAGGTGEAFDWTLVHSLGRPFFLAGGLNAENVSGAVALTHPYAVDVSSGVETDRVKDFEKMRKFICAVRGN